MGDSGRARPSQRVSVCLCDSDGGDTAPPRRAQRRGRRVHFSPAGVLLKTFGTWVGGGAVPSHLGHLAVPVLTVRAL